MPSDYRSPAGSAEHPTPFPARSAACVPSAPASRMQTAAGSGPAAASQPSPHRLASLVAEGDSGTVQNGHQSALQLETPAKL